MSAADPAAAVPLLRVVRGDPSAAEVAALVVVLTARGGAAPPAVAVPAIGRWADRAAGLRRTVPPGPGAWRAATR